MKEENRENVQHEMPRATGNRPLEWDYWMTNLNIENSLRKIAELRGANNTTAQEQDVAPKV